MIQTPATQSFLQQIMPTLVICVGGIIAAVGLGVSLVIKAFANKLVAQMQVNKSAADTAASSAQAAATLAASTSLQLAAHNQEAAKKLDTIVKQTNGMTESLSATIADQQDTIKKLTTPPAA